MSKKKLLTPEELAERDLRVKINRKCAGLRRTVLKECEEKGLRNIELQIEHLKSHPRTKLPRPEIGHARTIECFEMARDKYVGFLRSSMRDFEEYRKSLRKRRTR
jgi:hypothetical protein